MIDVVFLGTGGMMPTPRRWLSSFLLRVDGRIILFDAGEGTQVPWQESGWGFRRLDTICLSHWHADHVAGLPGILHALANAGRTDPVTIVGPKGTRNIVHHLGELAPVLPYDLIVADLADGQSWPIGNVTARVRSGVHRVPVLLYRFDLPRTPAFLADKALAAGIPRDRWSDLAGGEDVEIGGHSWRSTEFIGPRRRGISIGVMTDTRPVEVAAQHLQGVDLLIVEGTYGDPADADNAVNHRHMTFAEAAQAARECEARRLIITHFSPKMENPEAWLAEACAHFPGAELAVPLEPFTLTFDRED